MRKGYITHIKSVGVVRDRARLISNGEVPGEESMLGGKNGCKGRIREERVGLQRLCSYNGKV